MPRTKAPKKKPVEKLCKFAQALLSKIDNQRIDIVNRAETEVDSYIFQLRTHLQQSKISIPKNTLNKTIGELMELPLNWSGNSTAASVLHVLDATRVTDKKKKLGLRSSSVGEDEGYLTAESSKSTSGGRQSRTRSRFQKSTRTSRSLSTRTKKTESIDRYKTPAQKIPPNSYGTVTPKVKPNTPQVLLRRPKIGEVALSMQGSPLLTGTVVTDNVANINIPLEDGRLFSIQPQRGLRASQIPDLDMETRRQLETLRDNLNKVCALACKR